MELYKRQVKADREVGARARLVIRNFRIQVVKDEEKELSPDVMKLATVNKGTIIPTFNSVLRPEIHKFGTEVTEKLKVVWPELYEEPGYNQAEDDEQEYLQTEEEYQDPNGVFPLYPLDVYRNENEVQSQRLPNSKPASSHAGKYIPPQRVLDGDEGPLKGEILGLPDGLSSRPYTPVDDSDYEAITQLNRVFDRWLRNIMTEKSAQEQPPPRTRLLNGELAPRDIKDINWHIQMAHGVCLKARPLPLEKYSGKTDYDEKPYRQLQMLVVN